MARPQRVGVVPTDKAPVAPENGKGGLHKRNGRPSKYNPKFCGEIVEWTKEGNSLLGFALSIGVTRETLGIWAEAHPEFFEAKKEALAQSELWWSDDLGKRIANGEGPIVLKTRKIDRKTVPVVGLDGVVRMEVEEKITETYGARTGNTGAWVFNMINRFPENWRQRQEIAGPGGGAIPIKSKLDFSQLSDDELRKLKELEQAATKSTSD